MYDVMYTSAARASFLLVFFFRSIGGNLLLGKKVIRMIKKLAF